MLSQLIQQLTAAGQSQEFEVGASGAALAALTANTGNFSAVVQAQIGGVWVAVTNVMDQNTTLPALFDFAGGASGLDHNAKLPPGTKLRIDATTVTTDLDLALLTS